MQQLYSRPYPLSSVICRPDFFPPLCQLFGAGIQTRVPVVCVSVSQGGLGNLGQRTPALPLPPACSAASSLCDWSQCVILIP